MSNLNPFMSNSIRSATSKNTIDIEKFTESKSIIYVKIDTTIKQSAINKLAILLMYEIYNNSRNYLIKHHIEALPTPLAFVTDEFGNIPKISFIPKIFSLNRSENIFALLVLQSFSQIKENYGEYVTQELLDSTQAHFILGLQDVEFANKLSKLCGRDVRKIESISKSKGKEGEKDNKSTSVSEQLIDTIKPEDFIKKDADEIIVMCQNNIPLKTKFVPV
jgi:type IV secretion system protein VirD4